MTYFDPTRSEMLFPLLVSLAGLVLTVLAVAMRGMPEGQVETCLSLGALGFLSLSTCVSGWRWRLFDED